MKITLLPLIEPKTEKKNRLAEFPENKLGVIRSWGFKGYNHIGDIVILKKGTLETLQNLFNPELRENGPNFTDLQTLNGDFYIEVLPDGTKIQIEI